MSAKVKQIAALALALASGAAYAAWGDINMPAPQTVIDREIFGLHTWIMWICVGIFLVVFAAMFYSVLKHRKAAGHAAQLFHENTQIEILWTIIPFVIIGAMAFYATGGVLAMKDTANPDMTIKITGYQWKWHYDYLQDGVQFYSTMSTPREQIGEPGTKGTTKGEFYLLEVDNPMVVPVGKKVRLLITSNDVIHGWFVPQLGINQYGIPGFIKDVWIKVDRPGITRGQCSQICGKEHGFMPVVVEAKSPADYAAWVAKQKPKQAAAGTAVERTAKAAPAPEQTPQAAADPGKTYALDELKAKGQQVFAANCVACHQANGMGLPGTFPALNGSKVVLGAPKEQIEVVLHGRPGTMMAPWGPTLPDLDIAAVITYTRNAWDNKTGEAIQPGQIKTARK
jgi:cytochrome c oxidase subunit II